MGFGRMGTTVRGIRWPEPYRRHHYMTLVVFVAALGLMETFGITDPANRDLINIWVDYAIAAVGFYLVFGLAGKFAFSQTFMMALGGYLWAYFSLKYGFWTGLIICVAGVAVISLAVGLALRRVEDFYFAIATLAFTEIGLEVFKNWTAFTGPNGTEANLPIPSIFGYSLFSEWQVFWLLVGGLVVTLLLVIQLERSPVRRRATAGRGLPLVAQMSGVRLSTVQIGLFVVGSTIGGMSGALLAASHGSISTDSFGVQLAIGIFVMVILGGVGSMWGGIIGAAFVVFVPNKLQFLSSYTPVVYGVVLIIGIIVFPKGIAGFWDAYRARRLAQQPAGGGADDRVRRLLDNMMATLHLPALAGSRAAGDGRGAGSGPGGTAGRDPSPAAAATVGDPSAVDPMTGDRTAGDSAGDRAAGDRQAPLLEGHGVSVRFGGVRAVSDVSFEVVGEGEILGLVGPNGSGKSTLLNAVCGLVPSSGDIAIHGRSLRHQGLYKLNGMGVSRSFQTPQVFLELSCVENVMVGSADTTATGIDAAFVRRRQMWAHEADRMAAAGAALERVGLADFADKPSAGLSYGQQRLLELARCIVGNPSVLLLDEPSAGLNDAETRNLADLLQSLREDGIGMILVDHKVSFVDSLCDRLMVLQVGTLVASGVPAEVWSHPDVIDAYLGKA